MTTKKAIVPIGNAKSSEALVQGYRGGDRPRLKVSFHRSDISPVKFVNRWKSTEEVSVSDIYPTLDPIICRTMEEIRACMKIRYDEYCVRRHWESEDAFPDGLEHDDYDDRAVHILLKDKIRGQPVGTVRVIYAQKDAGEDSGLPTFHFAPEFMDKVRTRIPLKRTIEFSRFTISRAHLQPDEHVAAEARGIFPALALVKGALRATAFEDVDTLCVTMTLSLKRMLARVGLKFHDLGIRIQHRGTRAPLYRDLGAFLAELHAINPTVWHYLTDNGHTWPLDPSAVERERQSPPV